MGENYYSHVFLEEYKYIVEEKKISRYINVDLKIILKILLKKCLMNLIKRLLMHLTKKLLTKNILKSDIM